MTDRFNTIAGWTLFSGIVALGLSILSGLYFLADKPHRPHEMGYPIAGVAAEGGAEAGPGLEPHTRIVVPPAACGRTSR
jgi:cytochrome c